MLNATLSWVISLPMRVTRCAQTQENEGWLRVLRYVVGLVRGGNMRITIQIVSHRVFKEYDFFFHRAWPWIVKKTYGR